MTAPDARSIIVTVTVRALTPSITHRQQSQTQDTENNVKGDGLNQEQSIGIGSYPALKDDNNGNGNGYDSSIQPGQVNPSCKVIFLTIIK